MKVCAASFESEAARRDGEHTDQMNKMFARMTEMQDQMAANQRASEARVQKLEAEFRTQLTAQAVKQTEAIAAAAAASEKADRQFAKIMAMMAKNGKEAPLPQSRSQSSESSKSGNPHSRKEPMKNEREAAATVAAAAPAAAAAATASTDRRVRESTRSPIRSGNARASS